MGDLPKFYSENMKEARLSKGLTITKLGELTGVSKQYISAIERNEKQPTFERLVLLANILNKPLNFFLESRSRDFNIQTPMTYRRLSSTSLKNRNVAYHKSLLYCDLLQYIDNVLELRKPNLPSFNLDNVLDLDSEDIEAIALKVREHWDIGLGPISNISLLLENNGIYTSKIRLPKGVDGFSYYISLRNSSTLFPLIFIGNGINSFRFRFDLCHELGHIILHKHLEDEDHIGNIKRIEEQAYRFAGAFLMPFHSISKEIYSTNLSSLKEIKKRWGISIAAIVRRLKDTNLISKDRYTYLNIEISRNGWKRKEPFDEIDLNEKPYLLSDYLSFILDKKIKSKQTLLSDLKMEGNELFEFSYNDTFIDKSDNKNIIDFRLRD